jgi:hypothetical protein
MNTYDKLLNALELTPPLARMTIKHLEHLSHSTSIQPYVNKLVKDGVLHPAGYEGRARLYTKVPRERVVEKAISAIDVIKKHILELPIIRHIVELHLYLHFGSKKHEN